MKKKQSLFFLWPFFLIGVLAVFFVIFKFQMAWWGVSLGCFVVFMILSILFKQSSKGFSFLGLVIGFFGGYLLGTAFGFMLPNFKPVFFTLSIFFMGGAGAFWIVLPFDQSLVAQEDEENNGLSKIKILDTSVIIDGRISDLVSTGFLEGTLLIPKFVLQEVQALADSHDPIKRSRARRGLDILNELREKYKRNLKISSRDYRAVHGVDAKLINLAKEMDAALLTTDYNLNKVARIEGIQVLNLNDLGNALKPILQSGEEFRLEVIKEGKEPRQGVGYLSDGTMVVVDDGARFMGRNVRVKVSSVLQTSAGRIIFTEPV